jgi:hypothetical protein
MTTREPAERPDQMLRRALARQQCEDPEAHEAHMQMNGECPWCRAVDRQQIRERADWDFQDAHTVE